MTRNTRNFVLYPNFQETAIRVLISMSAKLEAINVMMMQLVRTMLGLIHVNATAVTKVA